MMQSCGWNLQRLQHSWINKKWRFNVTGHIPVEFHTAAIDQWLIQQRSVESTVQIQLLVVEIHLQHSVHHSLTHTHTQVNSAYYPQWLTEQQGSVESTLREVSCSGVTSHRQPRQCRAVHGPKTVKGAQSDPNYVSSMLLDCEPVFHKIITPAYLLCHSGPVAIYYSEIYSLFYGTGHTVTSSLSTLFDYRFNVANVCQGAQKL